MPCDTVQVTELNLGKLNFDLAKKAGALWGRTWQESVYTHSRLPVNIVVDASGSVAVRSTATQADTDRVVNEFKRAYSTEAVKLASQKFGWQIKQTTPKVGAVAFAATRRY